MERIVTFGTEGDQVGILSLPDQPLLDAPTVVMWNVGFNHRVGPNRLWVELSRRLSAHGIPAFRFDLSGLGDSAPTLDLIMDLERAVIDLRKAIDWLNDNGHSRFIFVSNCSGTDSSHSVMLDERRVVAAVYLDAYTYDPPLARLHRHGLRWFSVARFRRKIRQRFPERLGLSLDTVIVREQDEVYVREYPSRDTFEANLSHMVAENKRLLYVYSGETAYYYAGQFWDSLARINRNDQIAVEYYPEADHLYSTRASRARLFARVIPFIQDVSKRA